MTPKRTGEKEEPKKPISIETHPRHQRDEDTLDEGRWEGGLGAFGVPETPKPRLQLVPPKKSPNDAA